MKPIRIQLSRKKGWRLPPETIVVSRPSKFGNPFPVSGQLASTIEERRALAVSQFIMWRDLNPLSESEVAKLMGKNLACWCPLDQPCHADVLLEMVNQ